MSISNAEEDENIWYVIRINLDTSLKLWKKASGRLKGINLSDLKGEGGIVAKYGFDGMPEFVIIAPDGRILDKWTGYAKGLIESRLAKCWKGKKDDYKKQ